MAYKTIQYGSSGEEVKKLQTELNKYQEEVAEYLSLIFHRFINRPANAKITMFTLDIGGTLYNNCEYSNFKY